MEEVEQFDNISIEDLAEGVLWHPTMSSPKLHIACDR